MTSTGLVPLIRYRDVEAAVAWLTMAFGLTVRSIVHEPDGTVAYAELSYGHGLLMIGPIGHSALDGLMRQPDELGGIGTQSCYVAVDNVEAHYVRARNAGATIVLDFGSEEAGDRAYAARDLEGHIWNFGAYSPWRTVVAEQEANAAPPRASRFQAPLAAAVAALAAVTAGAVVLLDPQPAIRAVAAAISRDAPAASITPVSDVHQDAAALREALDREAHARQDAARIAAALRKELARERQEREAAEQVNTALKAQLVREREARLTPPASSKVAQPLPASEPAAPDRARADPESPQPAAVAATSSPEPQPRAAVTPATTGSIQSDAATGDPAAESPTAPSAAPAPSRSAANDATPVAEPQQAPVTAPTAAPMPERKPKIEAAAPKPRPVRQANRPAKPKPKPAAKPSGAIDPLFMYD